MTPSNFTLAHSKVISAPSNSALSASGLAASYRAQSTAPSGHAVIPTDSTPWAARSLIRPPSAALQVPCRRQTVREAMLRGGDASSILCNGSNCVPGVTRKLTTLPSKFLKGLASRLSCRDACQLANSASCPMCGARTSISGLAQLLKPRIDTVECFVARIPRISKSPKPTTVSPERSP